MTGYGSRVVVLVCAALVPVGLLAAAWVVDVARRERDLLERNVRANAEHMVEIVEGEIARQISALQALAASPLIEAGDFERFREALGRAREHQPLWRNLLLTGPDGEQVLNLVSPDGPGRAAAPETHAEVLRTGEPALTAVRAGSAGYKTIGVVVPVRRDGAVRYLLTGVLDVAGLAELVRRGPPGWRFIVLDREGRIIVRTSDGSAATGELAAPSARAAVAAGREGEIREGASLAGEAHVVTFLRSPLTGWTVHAGVPVGALSAVQTRGLHMAVAGAVAAVLLAAFLAYLLARELRLWRRQATALAESQHLEAIGRITGGIAHDFNNLLMVMQSGAEGIRRRRDDPARVAAHAEAILAAVERGATLIRQLLGYARRQPDEPVAFALAGRAPALLALLRQSARGDIETTLTLDPGLWPIYADPNGLEVALLNLATNARDAMPKGGTMAVLARNVVLGPGDDAGTGLAGEYVAISVRDTGAGIPEKDIDRIFQPFFTTKEPGQGTGLGLSQVEGFARRAGGAVRAASAVGEGTTVTLYLPRAREAAGAPAREGAPAAGRGGRVLLVEDNPEVAGATASLLEGLRFAVVGVAGAEAALGRLAEGERVDLVLSDILLSGGPSGLELAARLGERHPGLPVVLMTGYSEALADALARGLPVLKKPFGEAELAAALEAARGPAETVA